MINKSNSNTNFQFNIYKNTKLSFQMTTLLNFKITQNSILNLVIYAMNKINL